MLLDHIRKSAIGSNMAILVEASASMSFTTIWFDSCFFTEYNAAAADCKPAKMHHMPIIWATIMR